MARRVLLFRDRDSLLTSKTGAAPKIKFQKHHLLRFSFIHSFIHYYLVTMSNPSVDKQESPMTETQAPSEAAKPLGKQAESSKNNNDLLPATLYRMTDGLPRRELNLMVVEATECEALLQNEIAILEKALDSGETDEAVESILQNVLTPLDGYWTASSLLGRLRDDWTLPSVLVAMEANEENDNLGFLEKQLSSASSNPGAEKPIETLANPIYVKEQPNSTTLLGLWKKIYNSKSSFVFKKPVKAEEAPGYVERIVFPMDLSMVRKLIVSRNIKSYSDLHRYIGIIAHNCVKYNGRESEYGRVAREFEAAADELIRQAVEQHGTDTTTTNTTSSVAKTENLPVAATEITSDNPTPMVTEPSQAAEPDAPITQSNTGGN